MLNCKVNGKEIKVKQGTLVIDAIKQADYDVAHYCYHPGLSVAGVCRLCMVKIGDNPRLQIACNTPVQEGMEISNEDEQVKDAVKWGLDFHLINHPLDCPICDQAGECELQIQYMKFGQYDPEMAEKKVKKRKVVDLGSKIVLDTERCILCSRCVRFTDEVSKTNELGIFNRGDRSEVGTFEDKPLENDYALNTVDICPVGALTSKDFRFRQRVWYLKNQSTICTGCSTGCNVKVYYNEEGLFRVKPEFNEDINGYWMCDQGRDVYKFVNKDFRLLEAQSVTEGQAEPLSAGKAAQLAGEKLKELTKVNGPESVGVVVTGQYTNEEYESLFDYMVNKLKVKNIYHWVNNSDTMDDFDGLLLRGDKNPNTYGLKEIMKKYSIQTNMSDLEGAIKSNTIKTIVVAGPENQAVYPDFNERASLFSQASNLIWFSAGPVSAATSKHTLVIPTKTYAEKSGTYVNYKGTHQSSHKVTTIVRGALSLSDSVTLMSGESILTKPVGPQKAMKTNFFVNKSGEL